MRLKAGKLGFEVAREMKDDSDNRPYACLEWENILCLNLNRHGLQGYIGIVPEGVAWPVPS